MATYYAAHNGGGSGASAATPATLSTLIGSGGAANSGDTIRLLTANGTFQGANNMLAPRAGLNNITVLANDESDPTDIPLLDGQFVRPPINLNGHSGWLIEGVNVKSGTDYVIRVENCTNCTIRRFVAWDADATRNAAVVWNINSAGTLFEDGGIFGMGQELIQSGYTASHSLTVRRVWGMWEGSTCNWSPHEGFDIAYEKSNVVCENCFVTAKRNMPTSFRVTDSSGALATVDNPNCPGNDLLVQTTWHCAQALLRIRGTSDASLHATVTDRVSGSLVYLKSDGAWPGTDGITIPTGGTSLTGVHVRHSGAVIHPSNARYQNIQGFRLQQGATAPSDVIAARLSAIQGVASTFSAAWAVTDKTEVTDATTIGNALSVLVAAGANPFSGTTGAQWCYQWNTTTAAPGTTPLWPFPMNERIKWATANAGIYGGPCRGADGNLGSCTGFAARTQVDVTADIEAILGTIPTACRTATPILSVFPTSLSYTLMIGDSPSAQTVTVTNTGADQPMPWTVVDNQTWVSESPTSAADEGTFDATVDITGLTPGTYGATITVTAAPAAASPQLIPVTLTVNAAVDTPTPTISPGHRGVMKIKRKTWWWP